MYVKNRCCIEIRTEIRLDREREREVKRVTRRLAKITFLIFRHLADSVYPTISSGLQILMKGKSDCRASVAAKADFPK